MSLPLEELRAKVTLKLIPAYKVEQKTL